MTVEIERKFLPNSLPAEIELVAGQPLRQGYLAMDGDVSVRVRITATGATLTVKAGIGVTRTEVEVSLADAQAAALWPHTAGRRIEKTRYRVPLDSGDGRIAETDVYEGALSGLCTVEVEFESAHQAAAFTPPAWFGRDVTDEQGWTNAALALHGVPRHQAP
jgi:CYTH domain-containing protein